MHQLWVRIALMRGAVDKTICDKLSQWLATDQWFPQCTPVSSTNKTDCHDIVEILLKVALNLITLTHTVHVNSRGNVSWCNASHVWSSCENLKINTSKITLRRIVSQSVNRYHDINDAHDSSMQSADNRHSTDIFCVASAYKWTIAGNCHRLRWVFFVVVSFLSPCSHTGSLHSL